MRFSRPSSSSGPYRPHALNGGPGRCRGKSANRTVLWGTDILDVLCLTTHKKDYSDGEAGVKQQPGGEVIASFPLAGLPSLISLKRTSGKRLGRPDVALVQAGFVLGSG